MTVIILIPGQTLSTEARLASIHTFSFVIQLAWCSAFYFSRKSSIIVKFWNRKGANGPFPSSKNSHFRNGATWTAFLVLVKNHIQINGFAISLALKQRLGENRKWPIQWIFIPVFCDILTFDFASERYRRRYVLFSSSVDPETFTCSLNRVWVRSSSYGFICVLAWKNNRHFANHLRFLCEMTSEQQA